MTERERLILNGKTIDPLTSDESAIATAIANAGSGGGGGADLPEPGTAGNVLTSTGSGWESAPPADSTELVCTFTIGEFVSCDTRVAAIIAALDADRPVMFVANSGGSDYQILSLRQYSDNRVDLFIANYGINQIIYYALIGQHGAEDEWSLEPATYYLTLPSPVGNNGKVLVVDDGAYALVNPSALSNDYKVTITADMSTGTITADKAIADIAAAVAADKNVYAKVSVVDDGTTIIQRSNLSQVIGNNYVEFSHTEIDDNQGTQTTKIVSLYGRNSGSGDVWGVV